MVGNLRPLRGYDRQPKEKGGAMNYYLNLPDVEDMRRTQAPRFREEEPEETLTPYEEGVEAHNNGAERIPPRYYWKDSIRLWLEGYDAMEAMHEREATPQA
jgi:hypothetical protein